MMRSVLSVGAVADFLRVIRDCIVRPLLIPVVQCKFLEVSKRLLIDVHIIVRNVVIRCVSAREW